MRLRALRVGVSGTSVAVLLGMGLPAGAAPPFVPATGAHPPRDQGLVAVSADSSSDAWAVGSRGSKGAVKHWDGTAWGSVPVQNPGPGTTDLKAVDALSPRDVWLVGEVTVSDKDSVPLIEHWDGTSFTVVSSPDTGGEASGFGGVSAVSATDIWAVGYVDTDGVRSTLIEHWDGTSWSEVQAPHNDQVTGLSGVAALSADDVWASGVGLEHWNGQRWKVVAVSEAGDAAKLSAISSKDVWGAGEAYEPDGIVQNWNGSAWTLEWDSPCSYGRLDGIAAVSANDVWAVGGCPRSGPHGREMTVTGHWDGSSWTQVLSPNAGRDDLLDAVSATSNSDAWAVGRYYGHARVERDLFEHWDGTRWTVYRPVQ